MKQKIVFLFALLLLTLQGWATPVDESAARMLVQDYLISMNGNKFKSLHALGGSTLKLVHAEKSSVKMTQNSYYIFNTGDGFVIVAGDDRAEQILGYGDGELDMNDIPCGMQFMLDSYKEQIDYLFEHPGLVVETPSMNAPRLSASNVAPMLTAQWSQGKPYYNLLPTYNGSHCRVGCSCVALCQVMYYWKYPTITVPSVREYTTATHHIYMPALPSDRFHWNYIKDSYSGSYTADEAYSVAKLMKYAGQAMEMDYSPDGSSAAVFQIRDAAVLFGYDHNAKALSKDLDNYTDAEWAALILAELRARRPVIYAGWGVSNGSLVGHAFDIDGYDASKNKYHINWGWGSGGGYYALYAFNPSNYHFNDMQQMIVGLKPQSSPEIEVNPTSKSFSLGAGRQIGEYIDVNGYALTGDLTVKLNNGGNIYSIDKTVITRDEAAYGAKLLVWYRPTEPGISSASVTISGGGAATKTVSLSGTAYPASYINVNPSSLSFNSVVGETKTATFTVKCPDAIGNLSLKLNNGGNIYSIDKTSISKNNAINGATVTVTYKPTQVGTSNASVTISGGGANPRTVNLSGTATKPEITIAPTSLSFSAHTGENKTATFNVKGYSLTGDLTVKLNNGGTIYSIDKTSISKSDAINGTTVTVTYSPTEAGTSNASVTVSGGGAETKTVTLSGTAIKPEFTVSPKTLSFNTYAGKPLSQSFTIAGSVNSDLALTLNDDSGSYSIDKTSISPTEVAGSASVTVTYHPTANGLHNASVTISGGGAEAKTVILEGRAVIPVITTDVSEVTFDTTYTNYEASRTILITAANLLDDIQLRLTNDTQHSFRLSKQVITPEEAAVGAEVTIRFRPTWGGRKSATLNINSDGVETVSIPVNGTGIKSTGYITADQSNLSFETQVGTTVTKFLKITYTKLIDNGVIMISSLGSAGETVTDSISDCVGDMPRLNAARWGSRLDSITRFIHIIDSVKLQPLKPFLTIDCVFLHIELTGDDCFELSRYFGGLIRLNRDYPNNTYSAFVKVTYHPDDVDENEAVIKISLPSGMAKPLILPLYGTATGQSVSGNTIEDSDLVSGQDDTNVFEMPLYDTETRIITNVNELAMASKVYAEGQVIIIESPVEQEAIVSDLSGRAQRVNLQTGRNEIPVNASGVYIVRIKDKSTKLMLR